MNENIQIYNAVQGFNQALLLNPVFHKGLSVMVIGHNLMCNSMLAPCIWGSYGALQTPLWGSVAMLFH